MAEISNEALELITELLLQRKSELMNNVRGVNTALSEIAHAQIAERQAPSKAKK